MAGSDRTLGLCSAAPIQGTVKGIAVSIPAMHRNGSPMRLLSSLRGRRKSRGQSLVEFAVIVPVILVFLAGVLDLGRVFYATITMNNTARVGAFQAARTPGSFIAGAPCNDPNNLIVCAVQLESNDSQLAISNADITVSCNTAGCPGQPNSTITVTVHGRFRLLTPILSSVFGGNELPMNASSTAQIRYLPGSTVVVPPSPEPSPPDCTNPPNVIGMTPTNADILIVAAGFKTVGWSDMTSGPKNKVQAQNPDDTQCVDPSDPATDTITYHYRPS